ncbi:MAG TPA: NAD(P)(+) transhydrogenase (Re/Si-specific) subunit beta [Candidatus Dormibacteraeota bacterium]|jgi:NAD(P) transhydrogenase subunit beta|nr:NAD(P)(+) transhydrogenase (Re/Si-specific) subunit beta [Candidatus Dormibacteraeota bacterium]
MIIATEFVYLLAAVLFILGLRFLSSPRGARRGNWVAAVGMGIALIWTLVLLWPHFTGAGIAICVAGVAIGAVVGVLAARRVQMTAIPQMVAAFNGVGGGAAALVAVVELLRLSGGHPSLSEGFPSVFAIVIGGISFAGSAIAFAKLQELMSGRPVTYPAQQPVNALLALAIVALAVLVLVVTGSPWAFIPMLVLALVFGVAFVLPIGGADMPVVISMLNACTGLAVAASGFVLDNFALIVAGTLVGSSGTILTKLMSDAMGRSLTNVLFGAFGQVQQGVGPAGAEGKPVRAGNAEDIATMLAYSQSVIIVPGYGLAVAQAQHVIKELADQLEARGVEVSYAIHPVAGRMPGHMNVLLAEANVPYEQLKEMDEINDDFKHTDVSLVVGANDVVNPAAHNTPGSPIYGMPVLDVEDSKQIVFLKRSMRPGFAGIDNELLYDPKTVMLFGDAKDSLSKLVAAVKTA